VSILSEKSEEFNAITLKHSRRLVNFKSEIVAILSDFSNQWDWIFRSKEGANFIYGGSIGGIFKVSISEVFAITGIAQ